jgi:glutathione peroxidase
MRSFWIGLAFLVAMGPTALAATQGGSAFDFTFQSIDGSAMPLSAYKGKVLLVVNTASMCGYTDQYAGLQDLYKTYQAQGLVVIGVPSNDFGGQEPKPENDVLAFAKETYGVTFPMTSKYPVKGAQAHPFYKFAASKLGMFNIPSWNFHKYIVGRDGRMVASFASPVTPESAEVTKVIAGELAKAAP